MVDNRSAGYFGVGGSFNFKSGDISGTAAKTSEEKMGQGGEYFAQQPREDESGFINDNRFVDRSAVLRATLNSLAMMNVANVINARKQALNNNEKKEIEKLRQNLEQNHQNEQNNSSDEENTDGQSSNDEKDIEEQIEKEYNDFTYDI